LDAPELNAIGAGPDVSRATIWPAFPPVMQPAATAATGKMMEE
jgi:hypothetical protein